jgi:hypothetical protein
MGASLKERWKLKDVQKPKLSTEAQNFQSEFTGQLKDINSALQYTVVHGEQDWQTGQVAKREKLITDYQATLARFGASGPAATKPAADEVLVSTKVLAAEIAAKKREVKQSADEWQGAQPAYDDATATADKMEAAGDEKSSELRSHLSKIREHVNKKDYKVAAHATKQLPQNVGNHHKHKAQSGSGKQEATTAAAVDDPVTTDPPPTTEPAPEPFHRGLQTLFLTRFSAESTDRLATLLAA